MNWWIFVFDFGLWTISKFVKVMSGICLVMSSTFFVNHRPKMLFNWEIQPLKKIYVHPSPKIRKRKTHILKSFLYFVSSWKFWKQPKPTQTNKQTIAYHMFAAIRNPSSQIILFPWCLYELLKPKMTSWKEPMIVISSLREKK